MVSLLGLMVVLGGNPPPPEVVPRPWQKQYPPDVVAYMEARYQLVRDTPAYRVAGLEKYDRAAMSDELLLGDLMFHAPRLLGPRAAAFGMSCATCHPGGASHNTFFVQVASDRPGAIDLLWDYFYKEADDGVWAPRNIVSLRGCSKSAPYRRDGSVATLAEANALVVHLEFQQKDVPQPWLDALNLFVGSLELHPSPYVDADGKLTEKASAAARAGEAVFDAPRPAFEGKSCATCHVKATGFSDHQKHPLWHGTSTETIGTTTHFETQGLLDAAETGPYFYDGTAQTFAAAVEQIDKKHALKLSAADKASLVAYLEAIGAVEKRKEGWSPAERVRQALAYARLGETADEQLWPIVLDTMRMQLRLAARDAEGKQRTAWQKLANEVAELSKQKPTPNERAKLASLTNKNP